MADESKKRPLGARFARELGWDWVKGGILLLFPTVTTAVTAASAVMRDLPIWAIVATATVTFAAALTSIRAILDISQRVQVKGRLVYAGAAGIVHQKPGGGIDQIGVGLNLLNQSSKPIEFKAIENLLVVDGRVNPNPTWADHSSTLVPNTIQQFRVDLVPVSPLKPSKLIEYKYVSKFLYGTPGNLRHTMEIRIRGSFRPKSSSEIEIFEAMIG